VHFWAVNQGFTRIDPGAEAGVKNGCNGINNNPKSVPDPEDNNVFKF